MGKITDTVGEDVGPFEWPVFGKETEIVICKLDVMPKGYVQIETHAITIDCASLSVDVISPLLSIDYDSL